MVVDRSAETVKELDLRIRRARTLRDVWNLRVQRRRLIDAIRASHADVYDVALGWVAMVPKRLLN
jgi:hypothetical protein